MTAVETLNKVRAARELGRIHAMRGIAPLARETLFAAGSAVYKAYFDGYDDAAYSYGNTVNERMLSA